MKNFLLDFLKNKPLILAPMEGINDIAFRELCLQFGADATVTEFISSEALVRDVEKSFNKIQKSPLDPFLWVQIFGHDVLSMQKAAEKVIEHGGEVIDLNFGCPVKKIVSKGAGAALLKELNKLEEIAKNVVKISPVPVTAKIRLGWDEGSINVEETVMRLQNAGITAVTVHARTRSQMYSGKARWEFIEQLTSNPNIQIPIIGNGDITDGPSAEKAFQRTQVAGLMIGRAAIGNPFIFYQIKHFLKHHEEKKFTFEERKNVFLYHLQKITAIKGERKGIIELRQHIAQYFKAFPHFKETKIKLLQAESVSEIEQILATYEPSI